jgi:hypothetical protein
MQSGQVSAWVPIIVGLIGLIGVVAGQFVNSWREDRRWKREQGREDLRWKRQREMDLIKLKQENKAQWRETRLEIYADLLTGTDRMMIPMSRMSTLRTYEEVQAFTVDKFKEPYLSLLKSVSKVTLIGSKELESLVHEYQFHVTKTWQRLGAMSGQGQTSEEDDRWLIFQLDPIVTYRMKVIELVRQELGVEELDI